MKKLVLTTLITLGSLQAQAYDYPYLVFQNTEGTTTAFAVESLTITISDGKLVAKNAEGTQSFTLGDLSKMYFTRQADLTGISDTDTSEDEIVEVFTTGGIKLGKYLNINEAKSSLKPGLYILKSRQKTFKITIK
jgi:hypothetical protein